MNIKNALLAFVGSTLIAASAHAETSLFPDLLGPAAGWTAVSFSSLSNVGPAVFTYTLLSTQTAAAKTETFSVNGKSVFVTGSMPPATATSGGPITLTSFAFDSHVGGLHSVSTTTGNTPSIDHSGAYELFESTMSPSVFAIAYEDDYRSGVKVPGDFNDMVVRMNVAAVPEPETYAMMAFGLGALAFIGRRRRAV